MAKALRDPEVIDATFKELSKYHVGKLNGSVAANFNQLPLGFAAY